MEEQSLCSECLCICVCFPSQIAATTDWCSITAEAAPLYLSRRKTLQYVNPPSLEAASLLKRLCFCAFFVQMKTSASCTALQKTLTSSLPCPARSKMARPALKLKQMSALKECVRYSVLLYLSAYFNLIIWGTKLHNV